MNAVDFAKWDAAVTSGKLLKPESMREMLAPTRLNNGTTVSHGLAWFTDTFHGHRFGAHWGSTVAGYSAVIRRYDEGLTVLLLANLEDGEQGVDVLSKHIANLYFAGNCHRGANACRGSESGPDGIHPRGTFAAN